jgi:hypothetical protein
MAININSIQFDATLGLTGYSDFLTGNVGDKIRIKINFYIENSNVATADNVVIFGPTSINTLDNDNLIYCENNEFIESLKIGDQINIQNMGVGYNGTRNVLAKIDSNTIKVDGAVFTASTKTSGEIVNQTNNKGLRYLFNFVENGNDFTSLTDPNEVQLFTINTLDYTSVSTSALKKSGNKTWQYGNATVEAFGISDGKITYQIIHDTIITPLFLANQIQDTQDSIRPSYFKAGSTLNYIYQIDLGRNLLDTNNFQTLSDTIVGNVGWFDENFNGLESNYYLDSLSYNNTISTLDFNVNTQVTAVIKCNDASFTTSTLTKIGFIYLPDNESDYQENNRELIDNFCFDTLQTLTNDTYVIGSYFGGVRQIFKNKKATLTNSSTITITANVELGSTYKNIIAESDFKNFLLFVAVENNSLAFDSKDRVSLLIDCNSFAVQLADINLVKNEGTFFIEHPYSERSYGVFELDIQPVDDVVCNSEFYIDFTGLENDNVLIRSVKPKLLLRKSGQSDIVLESFTINCDNTQLVTDGIYTIQNIDFAKGREFKIPIDEIRKNITFSRNYNNDVSNKRYYSLNYPFMMRWEYWKQLELSQLPKDFFDPILDFKGYNQKWSRLANISGWSFVYEIDFVINRLGIDYNQTFTKSIISKDFNSNTAWNTTTISSGLVNGALKLLKGYEQTEITATFTKISGSIPILANTAIVMWIETFESGGVGDIRRISSVYNNDAQSWFIENKVVITNPSSGVFVGKAKIDNTKLPKNNKYTIYARIYELNLIPDNARITNDNIIRITIDNFNRVVNS